MEHPPVIVLWHDAHELTDGWTLIEEIEKGPRVIHSIGFLLPAETTPGHHVLAQSIDDEHVDNALAIPDAMVQQVRHLL